MTLPPYVPPFEPHPLLRGGHAQTLAGVLWPGPAFAECATRQEVVVPGGDRIVLHDDCPPAWRAGERVALLIHGLAGCQSSRYLQRIVAKLHARGVRTFRMNLRGCGTGLALTRQPYHAGRSEDAACALERIAQLCPASPVVLVGFSLGGNIALKLLGEAPAAVPANLERAMAVCPPIDLAACAKSLSMGANRLYDRYFARQVLKQVADWLHEVPDAPMPAGWPHVRGSVPLEHSKLREPVSAAGDEPARRYPEAPRTVRLPRGIAEFDDVFTAPLSGFGTAVNYYRQCSAAQFLPAIRIPTLILAAADDPLVPARTFEAISPSPSVTVWLTRHGGHLGFVGRGQADPDRRWMDWRVVEWCVNETRIEDRR